MLTRGYRVDVDVNGEVLEYRVGWGVVVDGGGVGWGGVEVGSS